MVSNGEVDVIDDESVAKMSGGDVDVELSLSSRNTLGNGNRNSNSPKQNVVLLIISRCVYVSKEQHSM